MKKGRDLKSVAVGKESFLPMQSIKEQHQIPDNHNSHHTRYGER
jgi:hypothetical protein